MAECGNGTVRVAGSEVGLVGSVAGAGGCACNGTAKREAIERKGRDLKRR